MAHIETQVQDWTTEAADSYLNKGIPLNTTIRKIATREKLNREKVARVVEQTNTAVFLKMFEKKAEKDFVFPLADTDEVLKEGVKKDEGVGRITFPEASPAEKTATDKLSEASFVGMPAQQAWDFMEKAVLAREILAERAMMAGERSKQAQVDFCKIAQQMVLAEGYAFPEICQALTEIRPREFPKIAFLLKVAATHLGQKFAIPEEAREKYAHAPINPGEHDIVSQLSVSGLPVEIINGAHKIVIALDTLVDQATEFDKANHGLRSADDSVKYLRTEIRNYLAENKYV